jgi:hypothetical protein
MEPMSNDFSMKAASCAVVVMVAAVGIVVGVALGPLWIRKAIAILFLAVALIISVLLIFGSLYYKFKEIFHE